MIPNNGDTILLIVAFPIVTLLMWHFLFNSNNAIFTKALVEGGYMLLGIPLIIITFLAIPLMGVMLWAESSQIGTEVTSIILVTLGMLIIIAEYFWIKRQVNIIEEREGMSIWEYLKRETSREERQARAQEKLENKKEAESFFDEITDMNRKKRELDREEKEKLRRALLGESDTPSE